MPDPSATVARGLDIGSNTFSYTEIKQGSFGIEVIADTSVPVRLSEGLSDGGLLNPIAVARGLQALENLVRQFKLGDKVLRAVGTAVLRMASNPEVFTGPATEILGVEIEILSGEEEALLMGKGAVLGLTGDGPWITIDVGGQSTEVCAFGSDKRRHPLSLPMGVVGLTAAFLTEDPPGPIEMESLRGEIRRVMSEAIPKDLEGTIVGVAGTATTLGVIDLKIDGWRREKVHGLEMRREVLQSWLDRMLAVPAKQRTEKYGVRPGRADVFPSGLCILDELLGHLGSDSFIISANGLRVGAALELMESGK